MFGKNPIRKIEHVAADGKLAVQEIFYTIQGEGPFTGCPAVFVRLAGCHLACTFCDTEFETGIDNRLTVDEIVAQAIAAADLTALPGNRTMVVLTGGEPLRQRVGPLCQELLDNGFTHVQIETAGNLWDGSLINLVLGGRVSLVCSPKTAHLHPTIVRMCIHYKYVVRADDPHALADGLPTAPTQANQSPNLNSIARPWDSMQFNEAGVTVWVSPCDEHDAVKTQRNVDWAVHLALVYGYRLSLQTHKLLGLR